MCWCMRICKEMREGNLERWESCMLDMRSVVICPASSPCPRASFGCLYVRATCICGILPNRPAKARFLGQNAACLSLSQKGKECGKFRVGSFAGDFGGGGAERYRGSQCQTSSGDGNWHSGRGPGFGCRSRRAGAGQQTAVKAEAGEELERAREGI